MSEHYPRIRIHAHNGRLVIREGLDLCFYMRHSHQEVAPRVMQSLETYLRAVGPQALSRYADAEGELQMLDEAGWACIRRELLEDPVTLIRLKDEPGQGKRYRFSYYGRSFDADTLESWPDQVSAVSFWLPTEYLEEHGPGHVRELAMELASPLPFCSGHVGLAFNGTLDMLGVSPAIRPFCFRHPGIDLSDLGSMALDLNTRLRGPAWLTFIGQPVLGELGGVMGLRSRLHSPGTTVQEMEGERALITLGPWPEAGDTEQGLLLPAYRELARVLTPWLYITDRPPVPFFSVEDARRWGRRFLD